MDYEQKYKHALERTRDLMTNQNPPAFDKDLISMVFPELNENEYEKIKFLIKSCVYASNITPEGREEIFTWLEKQKPIDDEGLKKGALKYVAHQFINWLDEKTFEDNMCISNAEYKVIEDAFLKEDWTSISRYMYEKLEKQELNDFEVIPGLYKCVHRMFSGTPDDRLLFEVGNVYKCLSKHDRAEFEVSYGHSVYLEDPVVCKYFIPFEKQNEQLDDNKPKFKVGDWIIHNTANFIFKIINVSSNGYEVVNRENYKKTISFDNDDNYHVWTIQDAKEGHVLINPRNKKPFVYNGKHTSNSLGAYFGLNHKGELLIGDSHGNNWTSLTLGLTCVHPATKEQRDTLMKAMTDAGYIFDFEKKELKKIEQKTVDKVESKFKVGDWITDGNIHCKITEILDDRYIFESKYDKRGAILFEYENRYHLWTIQDAKDGDVLVESSCIFIIQKLCENSTAAKIYWALYSDGYFDDGSILYFDVNSTRPATQEQCYTLFENMKEAGYEWDPEKKKSKKIEPKNPIDKIEPKFKVGDWIVFNGWVLHINEIVNGYYITESIDGIPCSYDWTIDNIARLWTIQDAKDGDVLVVENRPFIYNGKVNPLSVGGYCGITTNGVLKFYEKRPGYGHNGWTMFDGDIYPATKKQSDFLFQTMKEAGYVWDIYKKESRKIMQKKLDTDKVIE